MERTRRIQVALYGSLGITGTLYKETAHGRSGGQPNRVLGMEKRRIFISYRREGGADSARSILQQLAQWQPEWEVFLDVDDIQPGDDWRSRLAQHIARADTVLVLIGADWVKVENDHGSRRLDDADDVTRWEVDEALNQTNTRVIPVLIGGAGHLTEAQLPGPLKSLAAKQAIEIRHASFASDMEHLIGRIQKKSLREYLEQLRDMAALERVRHLLTPLLTVLVFSLLWIGMLDMLALDTRASIWSFALSESLNPISLDDEIALVAIPAAFDTNAPNARRSYADLIDRLSEAGAAAILFDLYFEDPRPADNSLTAAMERADQLGTDLFFGFRALRGEVPLALTPLAERADGIGLLCVGGRLDYTQVMPIAFNYQDEQAGQVSVSPLPGLALLGAYGSLSVYHLNAGGMSLELRRNGQTFRPSFSLLDPILKPHKACEPLQPGTRAALIFLRLSPLTVMRDAEHRFEMMQILDGTTDASLLAGRIFIVGHESVSEERGVAYRLQAQTRYGYELHADAINTLRKERIAQPLALPYELIVLFVSVGTGAWLGIRLHRRSRLVRWSTMLTLTLLYLLGSIWSIASIDLIPHITYDLFALLSAYLIFSRAARQRLR